MQPIRLTTRSAFTVIGLLYRGDQDFDPPAGKLGFYLYIPVEKL